MDGAAYADHLYVSLKMKFIFCLIASLILQSMTYAAEPPKAIALKNLKKEQVGFMLAAVKPTEKEGEFAGECVFMLLPQSAEVIESELGVLISELKVGGEHPCRVRIAAEKTEVTASPAKFPSLTIILDPTSFGTLSITNDGITKQLGFAERAKK